MLSNLSFSCIDISREKLINDYGLIISLHSCGDLTNNVLDLAIDKGANVISTPCCYGKLSNLTPKSIELSKRNLIYRDLVKKVSSLEGKVNTSKELRPFILLELYRRLIDFDGLFYLREKGYDVGLRKITDKKVGNGKKYFASPLNSAIIGRIH